jgi:hypothetical protein
MSLGKAQVDITGNLAPLKNALNRSRSAVAAAMRHIGASIRKAFGSAVQKAVRATKWALAGLTALVVISTRAAMQQEEAEMRLSAALKSTGNEVDANMQRFKGFASQLQKLTVVGDETTLAAMQMGITMGIPIEKIEEATKAAIGLSRAYQLDLNMAMRGVSLAMAGEFMLFNRYIPTLRAANSETEKAAAYQKAVAEAMIFAQEETKTVRGAWEQFKNAIGDVTEILGNPFAKALKKLTKYYEDNSASIDAWAEKVAENIDKALLKIGEYGTKIKAIFEESGWDGVAEELKRVAGVLGDAFMDKFGNTIKERLPDIMKDVFYSAMTHLGSFVTKQSLLLPDMEVTPQTKALTKEGFETAAGLTNGLKQGLGNVGKGAKSVFERRKWQPSGRIGDAVDGYGGRW